MSPVSQQPDSSSVQARPHFEGETSRAVATLTDPVARFIYAIPFLMFGIMHFMMAERMAGVVPEFMPGTYFWVYFTGVAHIAAAIPIASKVMIRAAGFLLAAMLLTFVATIHLPGVLNPETMAASMTSLLKDTALAGGALMAAHFASHTSESPAGERSREAHGGSADSDA